MEVVIAGAGSIGLLIGSFLSERGWEVTFFVRREEQAALIRKNGIRRVDNDGTDVVLQVSVESDIRKLPEHVPWIIAVKSSGVASIVETLIERNMKNPVMFVQNGFAHFNLVDATELPNVYFATVEHGAGRKDDRTVSHNGIGMMKIASYRGDSTYFDALKEIQSRSFPLEFVEDARAIVFRKVLINCMINPLTAILQVKNGQLLENKDAKDLFIQLYDEIMTAFPEMQRELPIEVVEDVCKKTSNNESSMLKDRMNGIPMEIDTIVSELIGMAEERSKSMPLLKTLEKLLFAIERG